MSTTTQDTPTTPDLAAIKAKQQAMWASGDFAVIGTTLQIVGELLCEAADVGGRLLLLGGPGFGLGGEVDRLGERGAVGVPGDAHRMEGMAVEDRDQFARLHIPEANRPVFTRRGKGAPIRAERD